MKYRTNEQFTSIVDNCVNGNWKDAAKQCVEYGFYAEDLIRMDEEAWEEELRYYDEKEEIYLPCPTFNEAHDIARLIELTTEIRAKDITEKQAKEVLKKHGYATYPL